MVTWADIKLITFQKMFAADGENIPNDSSAKDYLAAMPGVANEALQQLATAGKFIIKYIDIAHNPIKNLLFGTEHIKSVESGDITFEADGAKSFCFEYFCRGNAVYTITVGERTVARRIPLESKGGYATVKGLIENVENEKVVLTINSLYPLAVKNAALYSATFPTEEDVPTFAEKVRYDLKSLVDDFYMLSTDDIYYEGDADISRYVRTSDFFEEGNSVLVLDRDVPGNYRVYYKAYPQQITSKTPDETVLSIDPEVATLMPLYMASQLYKDDDNGIATSYRNEFEVAFGRLKDNVSTPSSEKFTSESGWI